MLKKALGVLILFALLISLFFCSQSSGAAVPSPTVSASPAVSIIVAPPAPSETATPTPDDVRAAAGADWITAYYNWLKQDNDYGIINVLLADLNFDGTPEILFCFYHDGSYGYDKGLTYQNGQAVPLSENFDVSQLIGTIKGSDSQMLWYGRDYPYAPHGSDTSMGACSYDFSDLPDVKMTDLLYITFHPTGSFMSQSGKFEVIVTQQGKSVPVTDTEYTQYQKWYDSDAASGEDIDDLPHLAALEAGLDIQPQAVRALNISGCYSDLYDTSTLNFDQFSQKMTQDFSDEQVPF